MKFEISSIFDEREKNVVSWLDGVCEFDDYHREARPKNWTLTAFDHDSKETSNWAKVYVWNYINAVHQ